MQRDADRRRSRAYELDVFRVYRPGDCGTDGYPLVWHRLDDAVRAHSDLMNAADMVLPGGVKDVVRAFAGHRCVRCRHSYRSGHHGNGEWSPCDARCTHGGPYRYRVGAHREWTSVSLEDGNPVEILTRRGFEVEAGWRILTVHHLRLGHDAKRDLRWWNLAALCQRCHLTIQGKVVLDRVWPHEHSAWFRPYAAGWYAHHYLGEDLTREQVTERLDELLALEVRQLALEGTA